MTHREPFASPDYVEYTIWNHGSVTHPTDPPGGLTFGDGNLTFRYRLDFSRGDDPRPESIEADYVACHLRTTDSNGAVWEARNRFAPDLFVNMLTDLGSSEQPGWEHNRPDWSQSFKDQPIILGLKWLEDDRFYRRFWIDDTMLEIKYKHLGLTIDVARNEEWSVLVRVSGWFGSWAHVPVEDNCHVPIWQGGAVRPPEVDFDPEEAELLEFPPEESPGGWLEPLCPIIYLLNVDEFLFRNDVGWDGSSFVKCLPRPIVFRRVDGETGPPQSIVTRTA